MRVNVRLLKQKIAKVGLTREQFAKHLQIDKSTLSRKLNEKKGLAFTIAQMHIACDVLNLTESEACDIFLSQQSQK